MSALAEAPLEVAATTPRPFRVTSRQQETADTWTLALEPVSGAPLESEPGQFTMLYAWGVGEVPISISGYGSTLVHTVRDVGAVSHAICAAKPGTVLGVRGPFGNAWPLEEAAGGDLVIVAGGIGLAPLHGALLHALAHRDDYENVVLLYGSRTPGDLLYRDELLSLAGHPELALDVTVDAAAPSWHEKVGVVPKLVESAAFDPERATVLVVGPEIMMRYTLEALAARGVSPQQVYVSMERNMRCGIGQCGHCQLGPTLICRDGPVYSALEIGALMEVREL